MDEEHYIKLKKALGDAAKANRDLSCAIMQAAEAAKRPGISSQ